MTEFETAVLDAKIGIKAYQNIGGSLQAFARFIELLSANDALLLSALFAHGVVKYAKPFSETKGFHGQRKYKVKHLKGATGFDPAMHDHILKLRDTLIAHDDLRQIEPRILTGGLTVGGMDYFIPMTVAVSNKCIAYPTDPSTARKFRWQVEAVFIGVANKLNADIARIREAALKNPEDAIATKKIEREYGKATLVSNGRMDLPTFAMDSWLSPTAPTFADIHEGFHYEEVRVAREFVGPEKIALPDGNTFELTP